MSKLRDLLGHPQYRPLAEAVARTGGLLGKEAPINDDAGRVDPLELVRQRAARDFAAKLLDEMGWRLEVMPPTSTKPAPPQKLAESDGSREGEG
jgi:hypothetical protein